MPLTADRAKPAVPFGGHVPHGRLRAVEPRQRRLPQARRPDAVQEPLAGPAHHQDLAPVDAARQLRRAGAGAAAARAALVRRLRRRDPPEPQPHRRRAAQPRRRLRCRPHLPHGPVADGGAARRVRGGGDGGRHPPAAVHGRPVRRHRGRPGRPPHLGLPREADRRAGAAPTHRTRSTPPWATTSSRPRRCSTRSPRTRRTRTAGTTWAATSSRCSSGGARPTSTTSATTTCPGTPDAERGYWRDVGTLDSYYDAHMDLLSVDPAFNLSNPLLARLHRAGPAAAGAHRARLGRPRRHRDGVPAVARARWCRAAR